MNKPLKITLIILAVLVVAAVAYLVFIKPKKASDKDIQALIDAANENSDSGVDVFLGADVDSVRAMLPNLTKKDATKLTSLIGSPWTPAIDKEFAAIWDRAAGVKA